MAIIKSCCCCRSLRKGCYAAAIYTLTYFTITTITMIHFLDVEHRYLSGDLDEPESESFLEPAKITPILRNSTTDLDIFLDDIETVDGPYDDIQITVVLNISLLACSLLGIIGCIMLIFGVYKDLKFMLIPWIIAMILETIVEFVNLCYLGYLQTTNFNPITSFLFTLDFFIISLNLYGVVCVISQFQEYLEGRGTAAFDCDDRARRSRGHGRQRIQAVAKPFKIGSFNKFASTNRLAGECAVHGDGAADADHELGAGRAPPLGRPARTQPLRPGGVLGSTLHGTTSFNAVEAESLQHKEARAVPRRELYRRGLRGGSGTVCRGARGEARDRRDQLAVDGGGVRGAAAAGSLTAA